MQTIVLDRDGVINADSDDYIKSPDEWLPIPGSLDAIALLHSNGFRVAIATNQSGIARGLFDGESLAAIHHKMCSMVEEADGFIEGIFFCPHGPDDQCECRKPKTGLLKQIEAEFECVLPGAIMIGDSLKDLQVASSYGLLPVLVRTGKGTSTESQLESRGMSDIPVFDNLYDAVSQFVLANHE